MECPSPQRCRRLPRNGSWCLWVGCLFTRWSISCLRWCFHWWKTSHNWARRWCLLWFWFLWWAILFPCCTSDFGVGLWSDLVWDLFVSSWWMHWGFRGIMFYATLYYLSWLWCCLCMLEMTQYLIIVRVEFVIINVWYR